MDKADFERAVAEGLEAAVNTWYLIGIGFLIGAVLAIVWAVKST